MKKSLKNYKELLLRVRINRSKASIIQIKSIIAEKIIWEDNIIHIKNLTTEIEINISHTIIIVIDIIIIVIINNNIKIQEKNQKN